MTGSPPRMRGKVRPAVASTMVLRITPAHAGKRYLSRAGHKDGKDHPRACGEKTGLICRLAGITGSPPRMRGKAGVKRHRKVRTGITPAHAGKRLCDRAAPGGHWDHPRACGEKGSGDHWRNRHWGSPPRMRGKEVASNQYGGQSGITPAHAGKRLLRSTRLKCNRDHPRACGEKTFQHPRWRFHSGSPPRMRGKVFGDSSIGKAAGITPAHAGKSSPSAGA